MSDWTEHIYDDTDDHPHTGSSPISMELDPNGTASYELRQFWSDTNVKVLGSVAVTFTSGLRLDIAADHLEALERMRDALDAAIDRYQELDQTDLLLAERERLGVGHVLTEGHDPETCDDCAGVPA